MPTSAQNRILTTRFNFQSFRKSSAVAELCPLRTNEVFNIATDAKITRQCVLVLIAAIDKRSIRCLERFP